MNETLLHQTFLAVLPTCLELSGWKDGSGAPIYSTDSRVRLAWTVAMTACEMHPTRPPRGNDWNAAIEAALVEIKATLGDGYEAERRVVKLLIKSTD